MTRWRSPPPTKTVRVANSSLPVGTEKVVQEGADGVRTSIYEVVWSGGEEISRQFVEELESTAVNKVIEYGTGAVETRAGIASVSKNADGSGTLTLTDGSTLSFSGVKSMTATAYTAGHGGADYTTATGTLVDVGTVAVDKRVIPWAPSCISWPRTAPWSTAPPWRRTPASGATSSTCTTTPISSASTSAGGPATSIS